MLIINKIYLGDCLELMQEISTASIDMILCDLPYGYTACKWDSIIPFEPLWKQYNRIIKDKGAIVLTSSQPFTTALISSNIKNFAFCWVWDKKFGGNFVQAKRQPIKTHEDILVFTSTGVQPDYYPQKTEREKSIKAGGNKQGQAIPIRRSEASKLFEQQGKEYTDKYPISIIEFNVREGRGLHPTQKPVALFEYLIKTYTQEGALVLDNCIGSGTTAVACINIKRNFIGIEKDKKYYDIATERVNKLLHPDLD